MIDGKEFGEEIVGIVKGYVKHTVEPLERRIAELEKLLSDAKEKRGKK